MSIDLRLLARPLAVVALAAALLLGWVGTAYAHTDLRASTPEEGSTVENVSELRLEFTGDLLEIGTELTLVDATGEEHVLEANFPSTNAVTAKVDGPLPDGDTALEWRVVAEDGHPIEGVLSFTYAGGDLPADAEPEPTPVQSESPEPAATRTPVVPPTPEPTASAAPDDDETDDVPAWIFPVLGLVAISGAGAAVVATRFRRR